MLGFLIAAAAGFLTPQLDGPVARPIAKALKEYFPVEDVEIRLISFLAALFGAMILAAAFDTGSAIGLLIGASLGYFGTRIYSVLKKIIEGRTDSGLDADD